MGFSCLFRGQTGAQFTLDSMKIFGAEYEDHIRRKKCTAGSCPAFIRVYIDPDRCTGCGRCIPACPKDCIEGPSGYIHMTEELDCVKCTVCMEACGERAVVRTLGRVPRLPDRLTRESAGLNNIKKNEENAMKVLELIFMDWNMKCARLW